MKLPSFKKDQIYQFIDKYFLYISLVVVFVIVGVGFTLFVNPAFKQVRQTDVKKADLKQKEYDEDQVFLVQLKKLRDQYAKVDFNDVQRLSTILPKGFDAQRLYQQIQQFVLNAGFGLTNITFSNAVQISDSSSGVTSTSSGVTTKTPTTTTTAEPQVQRITITVGVSGINSYVKLKQFISLVDTQAPILDVSSLNYPIQGSNASFTINTYFLQE